MLMKEQKMRKMDIATLSLMTSYI